MVLSSRPLRSNEVFQVRIDKMVDKWAGSIEIGVTTHNPAYLQLPSTMTNLRSGKTGLSGRCWSGKTALPGLFTRWLTFSRDVDDDGEWCDAQRNHYTG